VSNKYQLIKVEFDQAQQPKFEEKKGKNYVEFGAKNDYSNYLISLYGESPKHGAIIKGKVNYIFGKGFDDVPKPANTKGETWNQIMKRSILDDELHGGFYLQVIWNALGNIADVYQIEFQKVRASKDLSCFYVKDNWDLSDFKEKAREYPAFNLNDRTGAQILFVRQYNPKSDVYPLPSYFQGLNYIESDIQVSRHILGNAKKNFVATKLINFNNGLPQEEEQAEVEMDLKRKFANHDGDRVVIAFNPSKENAVDIVDLGETNLTKEDFTNINNLIQQEIFACHQVTSPTLFGIKTEGQLGARNEIRDAYQIFQNTYVNERQQEHEQVFSKLMNLAGIEGEWKIVPVEPLSFEFSEAIMSANMTREEIREKLGLQPDGATAQVSGAPQATPMAESNDAIKNLTGRQYQNVMRIVRQFGSGKINKAQASLMLKSGFGFNDEDVNTFLGIDEDPKTEMQAFASMQDELLLNEFGSCGDDVNDFDVVSTHEAKDFHFFADAELDKLKANILDLISKDKRITPEVLADVLKRDVDVINTAISSLEAEGYLKIIGTDLSILNPKYKPQVAKLTTPLDKILGGDKATTTEVLLRYTYAGPKDDRNRPFCARMLKLAETKLWSRSDIENISERLGYSVWDRRGGWFTEPNGNHRPYCRHRWDVKIVTRKK
jgi:DNA-binding Lrp family transcriptional regulator